MQSPGLDVVGFGYDVFGKYADMASKKQHRIFEIGAWRVEPIGSSSFNVPEGIFLEPVVDHRVSVVEGSSVRQYAKSLAANVGMSADAMFFSASVDTNISKSESGSTSRHYLTYMDSNNMWRVSLDTVSIDRLKKTMTARARQDINNLPPAQLFEAYGTHYIARAYLGGRADFTAVSETSSKVSASAIRVAVEAQYKAVSASTQIDKKHQDALSKAKTKTELRVVGGNAQYVNNIRDYAQYTKWADGIEKRPVLCDFDDKSLRPIWELADSPARRQKLEAEFKKLLAKYPLPPELANLGALASALYMVENVATGLFWDMKGYHLNAEAKGGLLSTYRKDRVATDAEGADRFIKVIANDVEDGWVFLQPQHSPYVLGIKGGEKAPGTPVHLWDMKKTDHSVQFQMKPVPDEKDTYFLASRKTGLYLEPRDDGQVVQVAFNGSAKQKWRFAAVDPKAEMAAPPNGFYGVQAVNGGKYWDFPGTYPTIMNEGLQMWANRPNERSLDRIIHVQKVDKEWYTLRPMHLSIHVLESTPGGRIFAMQRNAANNNQLWKFEYAGAPNTFFLRNRGTNQVIDIAGGNGHVNGAHVVSQAFKGTDSQKWELFQIEKPAPALQASLFFVRLKGTGLYLDISGVGAETTKDGANVQLWNYSDEPDRKVRFIPSLHPQGDGTYLIQFQNNVGGHYRYLDQVDKNEDGADVQLWSHTNQTDQRWRVVREDRATFRFQNQYKAGRFLDAPRKAFTKEGNGSDLKVWKKTNNGTQLFELVYAEGPLQGQVYQGE